MSGDPLLADTHLTLLPLPLNGVAQIGCHSGARPKGANPESSSRGRVQEIPGSPLCGAPE